MVIYTLKMTLPLLLVRIVYLILHYSDQHKELLLEYSRKPTLTVIF